MIRDGSQPILLDCANSQILRRCVGVYLSQLKRIWNHFPPSLRGRVYGRHLHALVRLYAERRQSFGTFFLRNRAELELMGRLLDQKAHGSSLDLSVLACGKGAEVYSILWTICSARPDLKVSMHAVDISQQILEFAERGVYSRASFDALSGPNHDSITDSRD